jgi:hypothetical protein
MTSPTIAKIPDGLKKEVPDVYLVVWEDARSLHAGNGWQSREVQDYVPYLVHQVGFVIRSDEAGVHMTDSVTPDFTGPVSQIPRGMIRTMKKL